MTVEETQEFDVPKDMQGKRAIELQSGRKTVLESSHRLSPMSSYGFVVPNMIPKH